MTQPELRLQGQFLRNSFQKSPPPPHPHGTQIPTLLDFEIAEQSHDLDSVVRDYSVAQMFFALILQRHFVLRNSSFSRTKRTYLWMRFFATRKSLKFGERHRQFLIEGILIDKHLYAWTFLANSELDGLIVMEDDCRIPEKYVGCFQEIQSLSLQFDYIDVAGGYSFEQLGLTANFHDRFTSHGIHANTTCCYYISKNLARFAVRKIQENPFKRYLGVGFYLNSLNSYPEASEYSSLLMKSPWLIHGSFQGHEKSSISESH